MSDMSGVASAAATIPPAWRVWMRAVRVFSFTASVIPVLIGSAFALTAESFDTALLPLILVASVLCHAGCNLANDYFDHRKGTDDGSSLGIGGVIQAGWLSPQEVRGGMIACFGLATATGLVVLGLSTWWLGLLAVSSLLAAVLYTGGPRPLGYHALGELTVWLFMGMGIVCGTYVAMTERLTQEVVIGSLGISALVAAILHANNLRDFEPDRVAGKRTLAHVIGWEWAVREFLILIAASYLLTILLVMVWPENWPVALTVLTAPAALALMRSIRSTTDANALNLAVRGTASLHFRFGLMLTIGLVIRAALEQLI
jgi:1,4-dihydroxy-2-naphthoate octaprenyltransferase